MDRGFSYGSAGLVVVVNGVAHVAVAVNQMHCGGTGASDIDAEPEFEGIWRGDIGVATKFLLVLVEVRARGDHGAVVWGAVFVSAVEVLTHLHAVGVVDGQLGQSLFTQGAPDPGGAGAHAALGCERGRLRGDGRPGGGCNRDGCGKGQQDGDEGLLHRGLRC
jgi:hypothetical protein